MSPAIRLRLADVTFVHWPVDPGEMATHVPTDESIDARDGRAWLSVVGMRVRPRFLPASQAFAQVNVRTYLAGEPAAVHFLTVFADDWPAVLGSRMLADVPSKPGRVRVDRTAGDCRVRCRSPTGRTFEMAVTPEDDPEPVEKGSLAHWLVERYCYVDDDGNAHGIGHPPWRLQRASGQVSDRGLLADLPDPTGDPVFHYSPGVLVEA